MSPHQSGGRHNLSVSITNLSTSIINLSVSITNLSVSITNLSISVKNLSTSTGCGNWDFRFVLYKNYNCTFNRWWGANSPSVSLIHPYHYDLFIYQMPFLAQSKEWIYIWFWFMVFNVTINNISVKSWLSVLLVEEATLNNSLVISWSNFYRWRKLESLEKVIDKLYHIMLYQVQLAMNGVWIHNLVVIGTGCTGTVVINPSTI